MVTGVTLAKPTQSALMIIALSLRWLANRAALEAMDQLLRDSFVLDDAPRMGLRADEKVRFARRTARKSRWCAAEHRVIDWASCSSLLVGGV